jgi:hypothetical protein
MYVKGPRTQRPWAKKYRLFIHQERLRIATNSLSLYTWYYQHSHSNCKLKTLPLEQTVSWNVDVNPDDSSRFKPKNYKSNFQGILHVLNKVSNPLTRELNPSVQRCLTRFFTGKFASWTVHFINICVKNQQMQQLFSLLIIYGSSYMFRHYIAILRERS